MSRSLLELQRVIQAPEALLDLTAYFGVAHDLLEYIAANVNVPTRIVSPNQHHYIFYQYSAEFRHAITRPLNTRLFLEDPQRYIKAAERFMEFLHDVHLHQDQYARLPGHQAYLDTGEVNQVVYTTQQALGAVGDSLENANQSRKRIGQLFERLIKLIIQQVGLHCEPRTIQIEIPGFPGFIMPYELDVVFSRDAAIRAAESRFIYPDEIVGSIKTTSKDRLDKVFLDKYLLKQLLGRDIPIVGIFLHDVQRAKYRTSDFGIHSTFKTNHFLGYTVAINQLDGVYYVDRLPDMLTNDRLRPYIQDFQFFLTHDLWSLTAQQT